jgi:hypothetical protein
MYSQEKDVNHLLLASDKHFLLRDGDASLVILIVA